MLSIFNHPVLGRGFRPFFLLGAVYSALGLFWWGGYYAGYIDPPEILPDPVSWHAHEMIYGFVMAIVAGFLLTAVANWTGGAPARQIHLAALCAIWLLGRIVMSFDLGLPDIAIIISEVAFVPALTISLSIPLLKSWNKRNFIFMVLLTVLFICDLTFMITQDRKPLYIALMVIITMISLIGGRIIPAFTVAALRRRGEEAYQNPQGRMDILALISLAVVMIALLTSGIYGLFLGIAAFISAAIHAVRMRAYHTTRILDDPMVWILHIGYAWVIVGLLCMSAAAFGLIAFSIALHALTAGAIGSMTLGMMCRVALGHTGRNLIASKLTTLSFVLMQCAAFARVFGLSLLSEYGTEWIVFSAAIWTFCFLLYVIIYAPILCSKRPDGRPA